MGMGKVIRIVKKRAQEMSRSGKVLRIFEFLHVFGSAEKSQGLTVCATPITVMGSIMGLFPLRNGIYLLTAVR